MMNLSSPNGDIRAETGEVSTHQHADLQQLVELVISGQEGHWKTLNARLLGLFERFWSARCGDNPQLADQLAGETVSEAMQALANGRYQRDRARFLTFAYAVARRVGLRYLDVRSRRREIHLSALPSRQVEEITDRRGDDDLAERIEAVLGCLQNEGARESLTVEERYVVVGLANQKTLETIARELGYSLDTVHRRKTRALAKLRRCLAAKGIS
jgi:RNA polymerase sigma factor (sigma-70 family)